MRLMTVLEQGFHGSEDAGIGLDGQGRGGITLLKAPREGWDLARPCLCRYGHGLRQTNPAARAQPFAYAMTGSVS
jgi:hypothetical protein